MSSVERFSDRVENYVRYRPGYPVEMLGVFIRELGLKPTSVVADVGCGPGQSSIPFLGYGCEVIGIEPNGYMRAAASRIASDQLRYRVMDGNAHSTGLPDRAVDAVIAAQAFHWFCDRKTADEFERICKPGGFAALIWNERQLDSTPFLSAYESLLLEYGTDYSSVRHDKVTKESLSDVFGREVGVASYPNRQLLDLEGIRGRLMSSSYTPAQGEPGFDAMLEKLEAIFAEHHENGRIQILYDTNVFYVKL